MNFCTNTLYNMDCIEGMKQFPDQYFDLAIVDPPYGIGMDGGKKGGGRREYKKKNQDKEIPSAEYWKELFRVSKNQIVWGGNYFTKYLPPKMGWVFWDKGSRNFSMADGELAWTSFNKALRVFDYSRSAANVQRAGFHPTEKPIALYEWLINRYAKEGYKILDTHAGSASSLIACHRARLEFVGFELDPEYFAAASDRLEKERAQLALF